MLSVPFSLFKPRPSPGLFVLGGIMTKHIRVENADTSDHKVMVQIWDKGTDSAPDKLVDEFELHNVQLRELTIWDTRYIVVKEVSRD